jgi:hypothetical protein
MILLQADYWRGHIDQVAWLPLKSRNEIIPGTSEPHHVYSYTRRIVEYTLLFHKQKGKGKVVPVLN